jgi:hypothetical protein
MPTYAPGCGQTALGCLAGTGRLAAALQTAGFSVRVRAGLEPADGEDLAPGPNSDGDGAGAAGQDGAWAVVGLLQGWEDAVAVHPDEGNRGPPGALLAAGNQSCVC